MDRIEEEDEDDGSWKDRLQAIRKCPTIFDMPGGLPLQDRFSTQL
jgi:hypothetical protein